MDLILDPEDPGRHRGRAGAGHPGGLAGRRTAIPGLRTGEEVPRRAAAAPGVPHDADGLVRPAAVAGRRPAHRAGPRRGGQRRGRTSRHRAVPRVQRQRDGGSSSPVRETRWPVSVQAGPLPDALFPARP